MVKGSLWPDMNWNSFGSASAWTKNGLALLVLLLSMPFCWNIWNAKKQNARLHSGVCEWFRQLLEFLTGEKRDQPASEWQLKRLKNSRNTRTADLDALGMILFRILYSMLEFYGHGMPWCWSFAAWVGGIIGDDTRTPGAFLNFPAEGRTFACPKLDKNPWTGLSLRWPTLQAEVSQHPAEATLLWINGMVVTATF